MSCISVPYRQQTFLFSHPTEVNTHTLVSNSENFSLPPLTQERVKGQAIRKYNNTPKCIQQLVYVKP